MISLGLECAKTSLPHNELVKEISRSGLDNGELSRLRPFLGSGTPVFSRNGIAEERRRNAARKILEVGCVQNWLDRRCRFRKRCLAEKVLQQLLNACDGRDAWVSHVESRHRTGRDGLSREKRSLVGLHEATLLRKRVSMSAVGACADQGK